MADVATPEVRLLLELLDDQAVFRLDASGRVASWSQAAERLTGFGEGEILDQMVARLYGWEPEAAERDLARAAAEGKIDERGWCRRSNGSRFFARVILAAERDQEARLGGYLCLMRDLSAVEKAEESRARRDWLETILQQLPVGVVICEAPSGRILIANDSAVEIMGTRPSPKCAISEAPWRVRRLDGKLLAPEELALSRAIARGERARLEECWLERTDGTRRRLRLNAGPIYERDGHGERIVAGVVAFVDVTSEEEARAEVTRTARYREL
ncbi:MAG TPA: PAS domain-containing protein, partial [Polyangia bacterium]